MNYNKRKRVFQRNTFEREEKNKIIRIIWYIVKLNNKDYEYKLTISLIIWVKTDACMLIVKKSYCSYQNQGEKYCKQIF